MNEEKAPIFKKNRGLYTHTYHIGIGPMTLIVWDFKSARAMKSHENSEKVSALSQ
jgi:hypothetical protein